MNLHLNRVNHLKFLEPLISVVFWLLMFLSPLFFGNFEDGIDWEHILKTWRSFIPFLALFLINRFVFLPLFFFRGKRWLYFISNVVLIATLATRGSFLQNQCDPAPASGKRREAMAPRGSTSGTQTTPIREKDPPCFRKTHYHREEGKACPQSRDLPGSFLPLSAS